MHSRLLLFSFFLLLPLVSEAQFYRQYFDGPDSTIILDPWAFELHYEIEPTAQNVWQVGRPQKAPFVSAYSPPNALMTDTLKPYPKNNTSSVIIYPDTMFYQQRIAVRWVQMLDMQWERDFGRVEFSVDSGKTWENVFSNPNVYSFYGFDPQYVLELPNGEEVFSGNSDFEDIWLCFDNDWMSIQGGFRLKFTFYSDGTETQQAGWMIDNFEISPTFIHTLSPNPQSEYLHVQPSPSSGRIHIELKRQEGFHIIELLEVIDPMGRVVQTHTNCPTRYFVDLDDQADGTYFIRVKTNLRSEIVPILLQRD